MKMKLSAIATCVNGKLMGEDVLANGVSIDTRTLKNGQLYIAIEGKTFDGHDFVELAEKAGAIAILTHKKLETNLPQILVSDTHLALAELAGAWRKNEFEHYRRNGQQRQNDHERNACRDFKR